MSDLVWTLPHLASSVRDCQTRETVLISFRGTFIDAVSPACTAWLCLKNDGI